MFGITELMIIKRKKEKMIKLPPIEKIPEAYTAIVDERISINENLATVTSSDKKKEYIIKWQDNLYYSNDASTYWQGYIGYPVIAVLMLQNKLSLNKKIAEYFKNINWNQLNKENKRNYRLSLEIALKELSKEEKEEIERELEKVFKEIQELDIELTKKKI